MSTHNASTVVPEIADTARRAFRTAIQAAAAVVTVATALAAAYQLLVPIVGPFNRANAVGWLVGAALAIGTNAALYARLMAIPAVNGLLEKLHLGGQSTIEAPLDTETRALFLQTADAGH